MALDTIGLIGAVLGTPLGDRSQRPIIYVRISGTSPRSQGSRTSAFFEIG